ncbi:NADH-quinone oxidoreductase subunit K [Xanthobacter autotrophicus]|uniref:NADH-quinone oxidoreductase subunit K n=1 Tax=Xanthobacter autotrophicus TaxID=280 RepID=UPI0024A76120|nr:NADH-quinone oxidoreductase subunit K [Xanthobacter autotrophicus]MDI4657041.1 NADH-quinone oxidoreductase subunit K [Xanthobacter autotrophicus]
MTGALLFGLAGAALVGCGVYGLLTAPGALGRVLGFNILGGGVFLMFGVVARRGAGAGFGADPVPQALVITGIVVAFCATALAVALLVRLCAVQAEAARGGDGDKET